MMSRIRYRPVASSTKSVFWIIKKHIGWYCFFFEHSLTISGMKNMSSVIGIGHNENAFIFTKDGLIVKQSPTTDILQQEEPSDAIFIPDSPVFAISDDFSELSASASDDSDTNDGFLFHEESLDGVSTPSTIDTESVAHTETESPIKPQVSRKRLHYCVEKSITNKKPKTREIPLQSGQLSAKASDIAIDFNETERCLINSIRDIFDQTSYLFSSSVIEKYTRAIRKTNNPEFTLCNWATCGSILLMEVAREYNADYLIATYLHVYELPNSIKTLALLDETLKRVQLFYFSNHLIQTIVNRGIILREQCKYSTFKNTTISDVILSFIHCHRIHSGPVIS